MNDYLSRHSKFDDSHYWRFERTSRLPIGYFRDPADELRALFVKWRWVAIAGLVVCLVALALLGDGGHPNW